MNFTLKSSCLDAAYLPMSLTAIPKFSSATVTRNDISKQIYHDNLPRIVMSSFSAIEDITQLFSTAASFKMEISQSTVHFDDFGQVKHVDLDTDTTHLRIRNVPPHTTNSSVQHMFHLLGIEINYAQIPLRCDAETLRPS